MRRNRLAHQRKTRGKLAGDGGAKRGARRRERWLSVMGRPPGFSRKKWKGKRRGEEDRRGEERREVERRVFWVLLGKWVCSTKHVGTNRISLKQIRVK